jgi:protein-S-isoprenylcysteine O-methyltransferase Ste14
MKRAIVSLYNILAYLILFGVVLYGICFLGNLWVSQSIDASPKMPLVPALLIDGSLLFFAAFLRSARSHSSVKRYWNKFVPASIENTTNIFLGSLLAGFVLWEWQPIGRVVWEISDGTVNTLIRIFYIDGWIIILVGFLLNGRKDLFGLKHAWLNFRNRPFRKTSFRSFFAHKIIRHPFYLGMLICLWAAPIMTVSHLFFAMLMTLYVITVFQLEEKNISLDYRERYPESIRNNH